MVKVGSLGGRTANDLQGVTQGPSAKTKELLLKRLMFGPSDRPSAKTKELQSTTCVLRRSSPRLVEVHSVKPLLKEVQAKQTALVEVHAAFEALSKAEEMLAAHSPMPGCCAPRPPRRSCKKG